MIKRKSGYTFSLTKHLILNNIWLNPGISRIELSRILQVNKSTVTTSIGELEEFGIIQAMQPGEVGPKGGRKPIGLKINPDFGFILGLELRTDKFVAAGVSLQGEILFTKTGLLNWEGTSISAMLSRTLEQLENTISEIPLKLLGIGLGLPGTIDPEQRILYYSGPLEITEPVNLSELAKETGGIPVMIENDGNCCAWGELVFRKDQCPDHFLFIMGEFRPHEARTKKTRVPAIGLGLVLNRKLQYGAEHTSGEFQSVFHSPQYLNSFSIADDIAGKIESSPLLMEQVIRELAKNVALIVNVLNLEAVILGGSFEEYQEMATSVLLEEINSNWPTPRPFEREILFSHLNENAVAFGAAGMFVEKMFSIPQNIQGPGMYRQNPLDELLQRLL